MSLRDRLEVGELYEKRTMRLRDKLSSDQKMTKYFERLVWICVRCSYSQTLKSVRSSTLTTLELFDQLSRLAKMGQRAETLL